ncbi:MAG: hypothetical protein JHC34_05510 [Acidobacteria bacterium]|nr:hypothetical protein [Acidobacteriota bacterium]
MQGTFKKVLGAALLALAGLSVVGQDAQGLDPLLKLLVENKVITMEQAQAVQAQYDAQKAQKEQQSKTEVKQAVTETLAANPPKAELPDALKGLKIGGLMYLSYQNGEKYAGVANQTTSYSDVLLKRGYFDVQKDITPYLTSRFTTDVTRDTTGDVKTRIKYLYGKFHWKGNDIFASPYVEFGQVHMPWLDFEEAINGFRMQDEMFIERNGIFNSADVGVMAGSNFGKDLPDWYKKEVNGAYAGRYGSWQLGVYTGAGYHAAENNMNKVIEARFSVRPFPNTVPGLQFTLFGIDGKGNVAKQPNKDLPDWTTFIGMASYESKHFTTTAQYFSGKGNQAGSALNLDGSARKQKGYSLFANVRLLDSAKLGLIGRFDRFDPNPDGLNGTLDDIQKTTIAGISYTMFKQNKWLLDYQVKQHDDPKIPDEKRVQLTLQMSF